MGKIASERADSIILTNDNPRSEDPQAIIDDILAGTKVENDVQIILDRGDAIRSAIQSLGEEEALLIAGKGHETFQAVGIETLPFDDYTVAKEAIKNIVKSGIIN